MAIVRWPLSLLVLLYQSIVLAFSQIWANKVRGILTTLGILIGVAAVIILVAVGTGSSKAVADQISRLGSNTLTVNPSQGAARMSWYAPALIVETRGAVVSQKEPIGSKKTNDHLIRVSRHLASGPLR